MRKLVMEPSSSKFWWFNKNWLRQKRSDSSSRINTMRCSIQCPLSTSVSRSLKATSCIYSTSLRAMVTKVVSNILWRLRTWTISRQSNSRTVSLLKSTIHRLGEMSKRKWSKTKWKRKGLASRAMLASSRNEVLTEPHSNNDRIFDYIQNDRPYWPHLDTIKSSINL